MIYINSNMTLLKVRNYELVIYNKVLDNRARLVHHPPRHIIPSSHKVWGLRDNVR